MTADPRALEVAELIRRLYPETDPATRQDKAGKAAAKKAGRALMSQLAVEVVGNLPGYSNRGEDGYFLYDCTAGVVGAFAAAYAIDPSRRDPSTQRMGEPVVVMIERTEKDAQENPKVGLLGGFTNLDFVEKDGIKDTSRGEQPNEGAMREFGEELIGADGKPVITPDIKDLKYLISGIDYRTKPSCSYNGFSLELTPAQLETIKIHAQRMKDDAEYREAVRTASGGEVTKVFVAPLSEALALTREKFTHPHEFDAIVNLSEQLKQKQIGPALS